MSKEFGSEKCRVAWNMTKRKFQEIEIISRLIAIFITNREFLCAQRAAQDLIVFHMHDIASTRDANQNLTIAVAPLKNNVYEEQ